MSENNSCSLADRECIPCKGGVPPLKGEMLQQYQKDLGGGWIVVDEQRLEKTYKFKNFRQALDFTVQVGELAESANHHPDIFLAWGQVKLMIWTHKIGGLSESDFILAAKADRLLENREGS
jgi:4a-hydroxytetrahydrobiopterin dehydratase